MEGRVARSRHHANALYYIALAQHQLELPRCLDRQIVAIEVAGRCALVRVQRVVVLAALDEVPRLRKRELELSIGVEPGVAAGVIKVEMRVDDDADVLRPHTGLTQSVLEQSLAFRALVLDAVDVLELLGFLVPRARIHQDQARRMLDEEAPHAELNSIPLVGGNPLFPERLGDDAEHGTAVQPLSSRLNCVNGEVADLHALHQG